MWHLQATVRGGMKGRNLKMVIGIVGLGLIGGSLAKAFSAAGARVIGYDAQPATLQAAVDMGICSDVLSMENAGRCDFIFLAVPIGAAEGWLTEKAPKLGSPGDRAENPVIMDCCGVKRRICQVGFSLEKTSGFRFVSIHPMAGRADWGLKFSDVDLFRGAMCAVIPGDENRSDVALMSRVEKVLSIAGFSRLRVMTPEEHDSVIALTSQLSHLVSSSFVKCDEGIREQAQVAGGSFRDMTRVAFLNENVWADLFLENRDNLLDRLDLLTVELQKYRNALEENNRDILTDLLARGREEKEKLTVVAM